MKDLTEKIAANLKSKAGVMCGGGGGVFSRAQRKCRTTDRNTLMKRVKLANQAENKKIQKKTPHDTLSRGFCEIEL